MTTITITKELIYQNLLRLLESLFRLSGVNNVQIKEYDICSLQDTVLIHQGVDACYHDILSDIDLSFSTTSSKSLQPEQLGFAKDSILGLSRRFETLENQTSYTLFRIILKNGMRYDIGVYQPDSSENGIFKKDNSGNDISEEETPENEAWDSFWFIAVQALAKLYRKDYLIADHLTNLLINETLVAQMVERDNQYHTTFHRYGYAEKLAYQEVSEEQASFFQNHSLQDNTFLYIADKLYRAAAAYDKLCLSANPAYEERHAFFSALWNCYDLALI